jgi:hypothetical protein
MFEGNNALELNEATMKEAVSYWLANKIFNKNEQTPAVDSIKAVGNVFRVRLKNIPREKSDA